MKIIIFRSFVICTRYQMLLAVKSRGMTLVGHVARVTDVTNAYKTVTASPVRKRQHDRPTEDIISITIGLRTVQWRKFTNQNRNMTAALKPVFRITRD